MSACLSSGLTGPHLHRLRVALRGGMEQENSNVGQVGWGVTEETMSVFCLVTGGEAAGLSTKYGYLALRGDTVGSVGH